MEWFSQNWVWVLFFAGFIAMHMFGHGGARWMPVLVYVPIYNFTHRKWTR